MPYHMGYAGGLGWLIGLLFLVGLVLVIVWLVNAVTRADRPSLGGGFDRADRTDRPLTRDPSRPTPNEILRERFARGEITEEQFEQMRKVLGPDR